MKLCLNTVTIQPAPLFTKIEAAAQAGFTGIEFHVHEIYDHLIDGGSMADVQMKLADHGLEVPCMLGFRNWGDLPGHDYTLHLFEARRRLRLCHHLGSPLLVCSTPMYEPDWSTLHERYADLIAIGREESCTPAFEFIGHYASIKTLADSVTLLDRTDATLRSRAPVGASVSEYPSPTLVVDAFHLWNGGSTPDDLRALPLDRIAHFHIDDADPSIPAGQQNDFNRTLPGRGPVPLADYLAILREKNYQGYLSLELFDPGLWRQDPFEVAQRGHDAITALL